MCKDKQARVRTDIHHITLKLSLSLFRTHEGTYTQIDSFTHARTDIHAHHVGPYSRHWSIGWGLITITRRNRSGTQTKSTVKGQMDQTTWAWITHTDNPGLLILWERGVGCSTKSVRSWRCTEFNIYFPPIPQAGSLLNNHFLSHYLH